MGIFERPIWLYGLVALAALAFGWPLCRRAIILSDEGYLLQQALDLLDGRVLYLEMDAFITPGMWFALAGVFALLGPSVIASRLLILGFFVALMLVGYRIVTPLAGRGWGLGAVAGLLIFSVWAFPAWTFAFYSPASIVLALAATERLLAFGREGRRRDLAWVGALLALSICFKQNYGVFAALATGLGYLAIKFESGEQARATLGDMRREMGTLMAAGVIAALPFLIYLLAHGALGAAWTSLVVHPFEFGGRHDIAYLGLAELGRSDLFPSGVEKFTYLSYPALHTPTPPGTGDFVSRLHVLLYWLAPLLLIIAAWVSVLSGRSQGKRLDWALFTVTAAAGTIFLGVFPRADFNHLINVYQPILVLAPLVVHRLMGLLASRPPALRGLVAAGAAALALPYAIVGLYWYAAILDRLNTPLEAPRGGVWVSPLEAMEIDYQVRSIREHTPEGGALLTLPDLTMLNFLSERPVPSAWYNLYEHHIAADQGKGVAEASEAKNVRYAVARFNNFFSDRVGLLDYAPELAHYLITHFKRRFVGGRENYLVYERRQEPAVEHPYLDVLNACESESPLASITQHLLFSALYHRADPDSPLPESGLVTRCHLPIPATGGVLALELGYRKPIRAARGTRLETSIDLVQAGARNPLLSEQFVVIPWRDSPRQKPFKRIEIDLAPWAGQEVSIELTTRLTGATESSVTDMKGFAMVYRDPRLQSEAGGARP